MSKTIAVANQKGGVGKTTTCVTLAYILSSQFKKKILVIDGDSQRNTTTRLMKEDTHELTLYDILLNENILLSDAIVGTKFENVYMIPADARLGKIAESNFQDDSFPRLVLRDRLASANSYFDYILIDCAPAINLMTISALVACNLFLIPTEVSEDACQGIRAIHKVTKAIEKAGISSPIGSGILICRYEKGNSSEIKRLLISMKDEFPGLLDIKIPATVKVSEANNKGLTIFHISPNHEAAKAYTKATKHIVELCNG